MRHPDYNERLDYKDHIPEPYYTAQKPGPFVSAVDNK